MSTKVCPSCMNTIAAAEDRFCYRCGAKMQEVVPCECGRELSTADQFCPKCGKQIVRKIERKA